MHITVVKHATHNYDIWIVSIRPYQSADTHIHGNMKMHAQHTDINMLQWGKKEKKEYDNDDENTAPVKLLHGN